MASAGYDADFLGVPVPLPSFDADLAPAVFRLPPAAAAAAAAAPPGPAYVDYIHMSLATSTVRRQPIVVALNVDQAKFQRIKRSNRWKEDARLGDFQLNNAYYRGNVWDRGHLARYKTAGWGDSLAAAQAAADDTNFYTNASLQHENFNQDEWLEIEDWVLGLEDDATQRISVFSGPIYGDRAAAPRFVSPRGGGDPAEVPAAFFKIVAFIAKETRDLAVRAFIAVQDPAALSDKRGSRAAMFDLCTYQVSVRMIELDTGLVFPSILRDRNPLYCTIPDDPSAPPEIIPVGGPAELVGSSDARPIRAAEPVVRIAAMRVQGERDDDIGWISLLNIGADVVSIDGWELRNSFGKSIKLSGDLKPGEGVRENLSGSTQQFLSRKGEAVILINDSGEQVDRVRFSSSSVEGEEGVTLSALGLQELIPRARGS